MNIRRNPSPPYQPRLLATNADGFHSFSVERGPTIEDCEHSFLGDDFINLHNRLLLLPVIEPAASMMQVLDPGDILGPSITGHATTHTMSEVRPGDKLKVFHAVTDDLLVELIVVSAKWLRKARIPPVSPSSLANRIQPEALQLWEVHFTTPNGAPAPSIMPFEALVQIDRLASFGGVVRRNHFHDSYNNLGRFAASNFLYTDNTVERCGDGIHISYDISQSFLEGSLGMENMSFSHNQFVTVSSGCDPATRGGTGCAHLCTNQSCIFDHVDSKLADIWRGHDNIVKP